MIRILNEYGCYTTVEQMVFNDGSVNVRIPEEVLPIGRAVVIIAQLNSPADQMALMLTVDALRRMSLLADVKISCLIPHTPYGRQDSAFSKGEANGMKVWARMLNSLNLHSVTLLDPHSGAYEYIDRCTVISSEDILGCIEGLISKDTVLVSPDAGANKKSISICKAFGITEMIRADKARDLRTGRITETLVYGEVAGRDCLIVDDIADGGATFLHLAKVLKDKGAAKVRLFVTHGMFTKGLGVFEGLIDEIHTTGSYIREPHESDSEYTGIFKVYFPDIMESVK